MYQQNHIEVDIIFHLYHLKVKFEKNQITFEEYSKLYDKLYQWVENYNKN
jgi:hypothetical protein